MASQSPSLEGNEIQDYRQSWSQISQSMNAGSSWSGHERNSAYVQRPDGSFVAAAGALGLDFDHDGRAVAQVDWDQDGDLDLWIRSRTGPALRYLQNENQGPTLALQVQGPGPSDGTWIDAIGAQVRLTLGDTTQVFEVHAGEGYLSQSQALLSQALRPDAPLTRLHIAWPGGGEDHWQGEALAPWKAGGRLHVSPGALQSMQPIAPSNSPLQAGELGPAALPNHTVLRTPLALPKTALWPATDGDWSQVLVLHPSPDSASGPWENLVRTSPDRLWMITAEVDERSSIAAPPWQSSRPPLEWAAWRAVLQSCVEFSGWQDEPVVLIIDRLARLQVVHWGEPSLAELEAYSERFLKERVLGSERGVFAGRWFHGLPRDYESLVRELKAAGNEAWAAAYAPAEKR